MARKITMAAAVAAFGRIEKWWNAGHTYGGDSAKLSRSIPVAKALDDAIVAYARENLLRYKKNS